MRALWGFISVLYGLSRALRATDLMLWTMPGYRVPELCGHLLFGGPVLSWRPRVLLNHSVQKKYSMRQVAGLFQKVYSLGYGPGDIRRPVVPLWQSARASIARFSVHRMRTASCSFSSWPIVGDLHFAGNS